MNKRTRADRPILALGVLLVCGAIAPREARADYLVLINGDTLTGTIASESPTAFVVVTELVGRVSVKRTDVASLTRDQGSASGAASMPARAAGWGGALDAGMDVSHGNSPSTAVTASTTLTRVGLRDKLGLFGTSWFSSTGSGDTVVTTIRSLRGGVRYDHDLVPRLFGFGFGDVEHDLLQLLDLRTVAGGGVGIHAVKSNSTQVNLTAGASFAHDAYTAEIATSTPSTPTPPVTSPGGPPASAPGKGLGTAPGLTRGRNGKPPDVVRTSLTRSVGEIAVGEDMWHQVTDAVSITQQIGVFPAIGDPNDYRISFDLGVNAQLSRWLQWNITIADRYLHIPPAGGAVQNDAFVSTGLGIAFGRGADGAYTGSDGRRSSR